MPRTWYTRPVRNAVALSGRTPFAAHAVVPTGTGADAIDTGASGVAARRPAKWHRQRPDVVPGQIF